jgi:hypothetical protein
MNPYSPVMSFEEYIRVGETIWKLAVKEQEIFIWLLFIVFTTILSVAILAFTGIETEDADEVIYGLLIFSILYSFWRIPNPIQTLLFLMPVLIGFASLILWVFRFFFGKPTNTEIVFMAIGCGFSLITIGGIWFSCPSGIVYFLAVIIWPLYLLILAKTVFSEW